MLMEVGLIAVGIPIGWMLRKSKSAQQLVGASLTWTVRIMLFLLGFSLGGNSVLLTQISSLGLRALAISLLAVAGSLLFGRIFGRSLDLSVIDPEAERP